MTLKNGRGLSHVLFMYKSIHGFIEVGVSGMGYGVPYVRQVRYLCLVQVFAVSYTNLRTVKHVVGGWK